MDGMQSTKAEITASPKAHVIPVALLAQSMHVLSQNAGALRDLVETFTLSNPVVDFTEQSEGEDGEPDWIEAVPARGDSLAQHLAGQLRVNESDPAVLYAGWFIINSLDRDGYLREDLGELSLAAGISQDALMRGLAAVQSLEPRGVGARTLSECLLLQLESMEERNDLALLMAREKLEELAGGRVDIDGYTEAELSRAAALIRSLEPRPGFAFDDELAGYVVPDVRIEFSAHGEANVSLVNQPYLPRLSPMYQDYLKTEDGPARQYVQDSLMYARSFIYAVRERARTVLAIAEYSARRQSEYLATCRRERLRPLTLSAVSGATGMSVSTVSRAVNSKYAECMGRVFPLRELFTMGGSGDESREAIVWRLSNLMAAEGGKRSDAALAALLAREGINISRRTVNKYRHLYIEKSNGKERR